MNRICIEKITQRLIEMQGGGDDYKELMEMRLDTLRQNALNAGYEEDEIEVKWVDEVEWQAIQSELKKPVPEQIAEREQEALIQAKIRELAIAELQKEGKL